MRVRHACVSAYLRVCVSARVDPIVVPRCPACPLPIIQQRSVPTTASATALLTRSSWPTVWASRAWLSGRGLGSVVTPLVFLVAQDPAKTRAVKPSEPTPTP